MVWQTGVLLSISYDVRQLTDRVDEIDVFRTQEQRADNLIIDLKEHALAKKVERARKLNDTKRYLEIGAICIAIVTAVNVLPNLSAVKELFF